MTRFLTRRLLAFIPLVLGVWTLVFLLLNVLPGDAVLSILGVEAEPELVAQMRRNLGLDLPVHRRYVEALARVLRGDFGISLVTGRPVLPDLMERFPATLQIAIAASVVFTAIGIPLGTLAAVRRNSVVDYLARTTAVAGLSIPNFWLALILMLTFSLRLRLLPSQGYVPFSEDPLQSLRYLVLPASALGVAMAAVIARMTRSSLLEVLGQDYVRTARAKGLSPSTVLWKHALRNALLPVITVAGLELGTLFGGTVIVEQIFAWPGLGRMVLDAIFQRDYVTVQAVVFVIVVCVALINLLVDLGYAAVDPRIRYD
jgi:peptide/nickel transport system permease protein